MSLAGKVSDLTHEMQLLNQVVLDTGGIINNDLMAEFSEKISQASVEIESSVSRIGVMHSNVRDRVKDALDVWHDNMQLAIDRVTEKTESFRELKAKLLSEFDQLFEPLSHFLESWHRSLSQVTEYVRDTFELISNLSELSGEAMQQLWQYYTDQFFQQIISISQTYQQRIYSYMDDVMADIKTWLKLHVMVPIKDKINQLITYLGDIEKSLKAANSEHELSNGQALAIIERFQQSIENLYDAYKDFKTDAASYGIMVP